MSILPYLSQNSAVFGISLNYRRMARVPELLLDKGE
jgi:hypothetical protein